MIEVKALTKKYGPHLAVDKIDFSINPGEIVGFLGPNGAGKTTTIRIITGFMPATSGTVTVGGHDVLKEPIAVKKLIGYLPEHSARYGEMRVDEYLHYFGSLHEMPRKARKARIDELTDLCGLSLIRRRLIGQLSKGNKQRVGLAQSLMHDPPVLILDEPGEGLDPVQIAGVRSLIKTLGEKKTILFSTHILPEAEQTCERLLIIAQGKIVADGAPSDLLKKMRSSSKLQLEVKIAAHALNKALAEVKGISALEIQQDDDWCKATMLPTNTDSDLRETLGKLCQDHQWLCRQINYENASLEQFFVNVTQSQSIQMAPEKETAGVSK